MEVMIFFTPWPQDNANSLDPGIEYNASNTTQFLKGSMTQCKGRGTD